MAFDWLKVKTDYLTNGSYTLEDVAKKHGINYSYLRFVAGKENWSEDREKIMQKTSDRIAEAIPETLADVKLRHARIGRNLQSTGLIAILGDKDKGLNGIKPTNFGEAVNAIVKGINLERVSLGLNEKEVQDEVYQKFSQFTFIFNLNTDELQNFIRSAISRGSVALGATSQPVLENSGENAAGPDMGAAPVSG